MMAARYQAVADIREQLIHLFCCNKLIRISCVVVIHIHHNHIRRNEIVVASVVILIRSTDMIFFDCFFKRLLAIDYYLIWIVAVRSVSSAVSCVNNKVHLTFLLLSLWPDIQSFIRFSALVVKISDFLTVLLRFRYLHAHARRRFRSKDPQLITLS